VEEPHEEEAGLQGYSEPGQDFAEEAAAPEMDATSFGVDQNILEVKQQIESQLMQAAGQQAAGPRAVDSFQGASNIVGVGIGVSLPPSTNRAGEVLSSGLYPGKQALNLYVVERTRRGNEGA